MNRSHMRIGNQLQRIRIAGLLMTLLCFPGCMSEDEEDHHLEHLIPAHKPESFTAGVEQLDHRGQLFFSQKLKDKKLDELRDIVNWLPELAADSDLKRQQWEKVRSITFQLENLVSANPEAKGHEVWSKCVSELTELIPDSDHISRDSETTATLPSASVEEQKND